MKASLAGLILLSMLLPLDACSTSNPALAPAAPSTVDVQANVAVTGPGGYHVQTLTAWHLADVDHVTLTLYKQVSGTYTATGATNTISAANLTQAITLKALQMGTSYEVVAQAYDASGAEIDDATQAGSAANDTVTFTTASLVTSTSGDTINDAAQTITVPVRLENKTFSGQASASGVTVTNGTIVNTTSPESF